MNSHRTIAARAFTLLELLVVISIFVLILLVAVPSFASLLYSQERTQAENQLAVAMAAARSAAVSTEGLGDTAAVFFFDPAGRTRVAVYQEVGQIDEVTAAGNPVRRDVFVASPGFQPVVFPRGWMVRAFAPPGTPDGEWYEPNNFRQCNVRTGNWVFPETGFYEPDAKFNNKSGLNRQSFMVRFEAGTGVLNMSSRTPAIIIDPSPSSYFRSVLNPWKKFASWSLPRADDQATFVKRFLAKGSFVNDLDRRTMFGDNSPDTVLARPVTELALYDERSLAVGIKAGGVNSITGCIYGDPTNPVALPTAPTLDPRLFGGSIDAVKITDAINNWIQGTTGPGGATSDARIFTIDRYQGIAREVTP